MARRLSYALIFFYCAIAINLRSQNEGSKWYFGNQAGLDFMTNPPTILVNSAMPNTHCSASIADAAGNLVLYTNGSTVWNAAHQVVANGTGLLATNNVLQNSIIIRRPGSATLYYVFTICNSNCSLGLNYSIVDISLASGQGSVTAKNVNLYASTAAQFITAAKHCNGVDYWIVMKEWAPFQTSSNFRSYLLTSTGFGSAVISPAWTYTSTNLNYVDGGALKISANGKKLGLAWSNEQTGNQATHAFEVWDFDNTSGAISNSLALGLYNGPIYNNVGFSCEFSPDGTKFYGSRHYNGTNPNGGIMQFNLCAGSATAVQASEISVSSSAPSNWQFFATLQVAPNGKIYCANHISVNQQAISVINNPNQLAAACNFSYTGQSVAPKSAHYGLPNLVGSFFAQPPPVPAFTYTVSNALGCQGVQFLTPVAPNQTVSACAGTGFTLTNLQWNFGDPNSGLNNTSTAASPIHYFTNLGQYTVSLILHYSCGGGTDTLKQVVNVNQPCIAVNSTSITCASLGSATVQSLAGVGPFTYTWMPSNQTTSVATGLSPGSYTITVFDLGNSFTYTAQTIFTSLIPLTGSVSASSSVSCFGAQTGTGSVTNLAGGSGTTSITWYSSTNTVTGAYASGLTAGIWSVNATDALTGCQINQSFFISQPPALSLLVSSSSASICAGETVQVSGLTSGGTPGVLTPYTYTWTNGSLTDTDVFLEPLAGTKVYTLSSKDSLGCSISNTVSVAVIPNPTVTITSVSICPQQTGTLTANGAVTYTWQGGSNNSTYTASPTSFTQYTLVGTQAGCTSTALGSIYLYPVPNAQINSNSPLCNGQSLAFTGSGGTSYQWTGPNNFTSVLSTNTLVNAAPAISGAYNVTVTSAVGCTMASVANITIHPTPTVSVVGATVCSTGTINLVANSFAGSNYYWNGPQNFLSTSQFPQIVQPASSASGAYNVVVLSPQGCSNTAVANVSVTTMPNPVITSNGPLCANTTINLGVNAGMSFNWQGPNSFFSTQQYPSINNAQVAAGGIYTVNISLGPCQTSTTHSLGVWALPQPSITATPLVCETKSLALLGLAGNGVVTWGWSGPSNYFAQGQNQIRTNCTLSNSGVYTLMVTDNHNCSSQTTHTITIEQNPIVTAKGATVCLNATAILVSDGAASYSWLGPDFFLSAAKNPSITTVTLAKNGTYTVVGKAVNTCTAEVHVNVLTLELPQPSIVATPSIISCPGTTYNLNAFGGFKYTWFGPNNFVAAGKNLFLKPTHQGQTGTYTVVAEDSIGCKNNSTVKIAMYDLPDGYLKVDRAAACVPYCANFTFVPISTAGSKVSARYSIAGKTLSNKFSYCYTKPGDYAFIGQLYDSLTGCINTQTFSTVGYAKPQADFSFYPPAPDVTAPVQLTALPLESGSVAHANTNNVYTYQWYIDDKENKTFKGSTFSYLFEDAGVYAVAMVVRNTNACVDTVMRTIVVDEDFAAFVPNSFTPNNDNLNDYFYPVFRSERFYILQIFDRWGTVVYNGNQTSVGWDGSFKGDLCKNDVYSWKIVVSAKDGSQRVLKGFVNLLK